MEKKLNDVSGDYAPRLRPLSAAGKLVLDRIPLEAEIGYLQIRELTGLSGTRLGIALAELQTRGLAGSRELIDQRYYWRTPHRPRKFWYTIDEAADHMTVSKRTVQQLIREGQLPASRVGRGGHRRIRWEDLDSAMIPDVGVGATAITAADDRVLAGLWDNEQDSIYDNL